MKKKTKKLVLAKETLRSLESAAIRKIVGGADDSEASCAATCTATSNYPTVYNSFCRYCVDEPIGP